MRKGFASKAYQRHISRPFFFVDNSLSGSGSEDPEVVLLRQRIRHLAMTQPETKQKVPVKWLKFELSLEHMVRDGHHLLTFDEAKVLAKEVSKIFFVILVDFHFNFGAT